MVSRPAIDFWCRSLFVPAEREREVLVEDCYLQHGCPILNRNAMVSSWQESTRKVCLVTSVVAFRPLVIRDSMVVDRGDRTL